MVRLYDNLPGAYLSHMYVSCTIKFKYHGGDEGARQMIPFFFLL